MKENAVMKKRNYRLLILPLLTLILQMLPYGAVLNFANPEGESFRRTYSYFSLVPFGYANFGPFITAVLTCSLMVMAVILLFKYNKTVYRAALAISAVAFAVSLTPLLYGVRYMSVIGVIISVALGAQTVLLFATNKDKKEEK